MSSRQDQQPSIWRESRERRARYLSAITADPLESLDARSAGQSIDDAMDYGDERIVRLLMGPTSSPTPDERFAINPFVLSPMRRTSLLESPNVAFLSNSAYDAETERLYNSSCFPATAKTPPLPSLGTSGSFVISPSAPVAIAATAVQPLLEFTCFPALPHELRAMIWDKVCFVNRVIELRCCPTGERGQVGNVDLQPLVARKYTGYVTQPAILHTSKEARKIGLKHYTLEFSTTGNDRDLVRLSTLANLYINFDSNIICPIFGSHTGYTNLADEKMYLDIKRSKKVLRLGLRSSEVSLGSWRKVLEGNTSITEVILFSETKSVEGLLEPVCDMTKNVVLKMDKVQGYIDRSWVDEGFDDEEEDCLLEFKFAISEDLGRKQRKLEVKDRIPLPKISFGILKAHFKPAGLRIRQVKS